MTPREFFNAWLGKQDADRKKYESYRDLHWLVGQQNATWTAFSSKQSKAIAKQKPPWEKIRKIEPLDYDKMKGFFNMISKNGN